VHPRWKRFWRGAKPDVKTPTIRRRPRCSWKKCSRFSEDGSFDGDLVRTAESLLLLGSLQATPARDERCDNAVAWMLQQRDVPRRFAGTCDPAAHQLGVCSHFLTGFFSPGPREVPLDGLRFSNGLQFNTDEDARLAASARAASAALEQRDRRTHRTDQRAQKLAAMIFRRCIEIRWAVPSSRCSPLIDLPPEGDHTTVVQGALGRLAAPSAATALARAGSAARR
jgi:hypothetical protein